LAACAGGISVPNLAPGATAEPTSATPATATAAPAAAATPAPAAQPAKPPPPPPPQKLTATEINEACWMDAAINKVPDLDKRLKLVDKCVDQKTKAQGGL
jgi:3-oxoacyl-ACP reductase-like protein